MNTKITLLFILFFSLNSFSQRSNIAHINTNTLWSKMPEKAKADSTIMLLQTEFAYYYENLVSKYKHDLEQFNTDENSNDLIKQQQSKELIQQQTNISDYRIKAQQNIKSQKDSLYKPIKLEMQNAIDAVATKLKYDYVLDSSFGNIIFVRHEKDNILGDVLIYLKIDE